jgi:hypothetical protein
MGNFDPSLVILEEQVGHYSLKVSSWLQNSVFITEIPV